MGSWRRVFRYLISTGVVLLATNCITAAQSATTPTSVAKSEPTNPQQKPFFIVWAHTDIPDRGAPTLDLVDLERYFAQQLTERNVENVAPFATTKMPKPPAANVYVLELSVDTMRVAQRSTRNQQYDFYENHDIFEVDFSLSIKHLQTGHIEGTSGERYEHWFVRGSEDDRMIEKRAAILKAADNLADRFVELARGGQLGKLFSDPAPSFWDGFDFKFVGWAIGGAVFIIILFSSLTRAIAAGNKSRRDWQEHTSEEQARERDRERQQRERDRQQSERDHHQWDIELENAVALSLKTQEFSDAACEAAAQAQFDHLLTIHAEIEMKEAQRQLQSRKREAHYAQLAKHAAANSSLEEAKIIEILRKADEWEYRVLKEAKAIATSVPNYE